ncbi:MAG: hypothetical protein HRT34_04740 [Alcanivorax sp.]|nr:hypothetical protein [Alcanivorax sp.]
MEVKLTEQQAIRLRLLVNHGASRKRLLLQEFREEGDPMKLRSVEALEMDLEKLLELRKILTDAFEQEAEEEIEIT